MFVDVGIYSWPSNNTLGSSFTSTPSPKVSVNNIVLLSTFPEPSNGDDVPEIISEVISSKIEFNLLR